MWDIPSSASKSLNLLTNKASGWTIVLCCKIDIWEVNCHFLPPVWLHPQNTCLQTEKDHKIIQISIFSIFLHSPEINSWLCYYMDEYHHGCFFLFLIVQKCKNSESWFCYITVHWSTVWCKNPYYMLGSTVINCFKQLLFPERPLKSHKHAIPKRQVKLI